MVSLDTGQDASSPYQSIQNEVFVYLKHPSVAQKADVSLVSSSRPHFTFVVFPKQVTSCRLVMISHVSSTVTKKLWKGRCLMVIPLDLQCLSVSTAFPVQAVD